LSIEQIERKSSEKNKIKEKEVREKKIKKMI